MSDNIDRRGLLSLAAAASALLASTELAFGEQGRERVELFLAALLDVRPEGDTFRVLINANDDDLAIGALFKSGVADLLPPAQLQGTANAVKEMAAKLPVDEEGVITNKSSWELLDDLHAALVGDDGGRFGC